MNKMSGIIFSNIYDDSLGELTAKRTVASLPFGGRYRQIDYVLSNMVNSGIISVGVITKYNYESLMDHLGSSEAWDLNRKNGGLFIIPPFAFGKSEVYRGKLDALYTALNFLNSQKSEYIVLSDTITICNINYQEVLAEHIASDKDITIVVSTQKEDEQNHNIVVESNIDCSAKKININCEAKIGSFVGLGMYVMKREALIKVVKECVEAGHYHFEKDFLQKYFNENRLSVNLYEFEGVVFRNRNIEAYLKNNIKLIDEEIHKELYKSSAPIYTKVRDEIPTYYGNDSAVDKCIIADGCKIYGKLKNSVIFRDVTIEEGAQVISSIVMQGTKIKQGAFIENAIIDKNVTITENTWLSGALKCPVIVKKGEII